MRWFKVFWNERKGFYFDPLQRIILWGLRIIIVLLMMFAIAALLSSCKSIKTGVNEKSETSDSTHVEYIERVVKVPVTVYVEVPAEKQIQMTDSTSILETKFALSEASMVWINGVPFLRHSLETKPQKIEKTDSVPVIYKERAVWNTRRVSYTRTEIREKQLTWWEKVKIKTFEYIGILFIAIFISLVIVLIRWYLKKSSS